MKTRLLHAVRFRIAAWNALGVSIVALLALLGVRSGVWWTILAELDQILSEDAGEIQLALEDKTQASFDSLTEYLRRKSIGHRRHEWFVALYGDGGRLLWTSRDDAKSLPSPRELPDSHPETRNELRVMRVTPPPNPYAVADVSIGSSLELLREDMQRIDRLVAAAAAAILLASPLCGYWLAGRATRTVGTLTATASRLRPEHLSERLPIQGSGDEFDRLSQTINHLLDHIAAYIQQKRDILASSAHELRTPLAAIRSSIEVTLASERSADIYRELLEDIIEEGAILETLVNQLLLLSESESDRDHKTWESARLHKVVEKAIDMFAGVAESGGVSLVAARIEPFTVSGNRAHLRHVVNNLLDNAIKYTPSGGAVSVTLSGGDDEICRLTVSDTGAGIAPEDLPLIFDRFFRTDRARRRDEVTGTGLGLSICKAIIEAHGGSIVCESRVGEGSTFVVELPTQQRDQPRAIGAS